MLGPAQCHAPPQPLGLHDPRGSIPAWDTLWFCGEFFMFCTFRRHLNSVLIDSLLLIFTTVTFGFTPSEILSCPLQAVCLFGCRKFNPWL